MSKRRKSNPVVNSMGEHPSRPSPPGNIKLNLGCGRHAISGFTNVDLAVPGHTPDITMDIEHASLDEWLSHWDEHSVGFAQLIHVIEHLDSALLMMENLWHVSRPGALCVVHCPHGASDDAWEDPTHKRPYYPRSFQYFSQPMYWRADYGYRGDWQVERCKLIAPNSVLPQKPQLLNYSRNVVAEMRVEMRAVKPRRDPSRSLIEFPRILYTDKA